MTAGRWLVTLHPSYSERQLAARETNLDPDDHAHLREVLEDMVLQLRGTLRLHLEDYRIRIRKPGSTVWGWCGIDRSGRTVIKRP